ncbi:MAG: septum formation initiator family protein [bacterium]
MTERRNRPAPAAGKFLRRSPQVNWFARRSLCALAGVTLVLLLLLPLLGENGLPAYIRLRNQRDDLRREVESLLQQDLELQQDIDDLRHNREALERLARERYDMHAPGETIYEVVDETPSGERSP